MEKDPRKMEMGNVPHNRGCGEFAAVVLTVFVLLTALACGQFPIGE